MDDDEFPRINTGNGFQNDLIATTNDRIKKQVIATRELHDSIKVLDSSIKSFNKESSSQTNKLISLTKSITKSNEEASNQSKTMITLTKWVVVLTIVLVIGLIIQIVALFK